MQRRRVVPGEHHVLDDHDLKLVVDLREPFLDGGILGVPPHVVHHWRLVGGCAGVDDLDEALIEVVGVPVGPQGDDRGVKVGADFAGGADDHRFAGRLDERAHPGAAVLPLLHDLLGEVC